MTMTDCSESSPSHFPSHGVNADWVGEERV